MERSATQQRPGALYLLTTLRRYLWEIMALGIVAAFFALLVAGSMRPLYRSTATLSFSFSTTHDQSFMQHQAQQVVSSERISRVITRLHLANHADYLHANKGNLLSQWRALFSGILSNEDEKPSDAERDQSAEDASVERWFSDQVATEVLADGELMIHFDTTDPNLAKDCVNLLALFYMQDVSLIGFEKSDGSPVVDPEITVEMTHEGESAEKPVWPDRTQLVAWSMAIAMLFGLLLVLIRERLDDTLNDAASVQSRLHLPLLGEFTLAGEELNVTAATPGFSAADPFDASGASAEKPHDDASAGGGDSAIAPWRDSVIESCKVRGRGLILVTSTHNGEGKSRVAMKLAQALATKGRTLLVDLDYNRPNLGRMVGLERGAPGLFHLATDRLSHDECIYNTSRRDLYALPIGVNGPETRTLLSSDRFIGVMDDLCDRHNWVVLDSAPLQESSQFLALLPSLGALTLVARADSTPTSLVYGSVKKLRLNDAPILGVVLTREHEGGGRRFHGWKHQSHSPRAGSA